MPPPFHLHHDPAAYERPTPCRIVLTLLVAVLVPLAYSSIRPRLKRMVSAYEHRKRFRRIANDLDVKEEEKKRRRRRRETEGIGREEEEESLGKGRRTIVVSGLFVHPVKSLRPVPVHSRRITSAFGLDGDRTLMIVRPRRAGASAGAAVEVEATHRFVTQRQCPYLARIDASLPVSVGGRTIVRLSCKDEDLDPPPPPGYGTEEVENDGEGGGKGNKKEKDGNGDKDGDGDDDCEDADRSAVHVDITPSSLLRYPLRYRAALWDDVVNVVDVGDDAASLLRRVIRAAIKRDGGANHGDSGGDDASNLANDDFRDVRLVALLPPTSSPWHSSDRPIPDAYLPPAAYTIMGGVPTTSLNDGFSILITNESSLDELNRRLVAKGENPLHMSRFRPNIVVRGAEPFEEDTWKAIRIRPPPPPPSSSDPDDHDKDKGKGDGGRKSRRRETILHLVKGCPRCKQSCTDQATGDRGLEPLATLATFRALNGRCPAEVYFGQNAVPQPEGWWALWRRGGGEGYASTMEVRLGDVVDVLTRGEPVWDREDVRAE